MLEKCICRMEPRKIWVGTQSVTIEMSPAYKSAVFQIDWLSLHLLPKRALKTCSREWSVLFSLIYSVISIKQSVIDITSFSFNSRWLNTKQLYLNQEIKYQVSCVYILHFELSVIVFYGCLAEYIFKNRFCIPNLEVHVFAFNNYLI